MNRKTYIAIVGMAGSGKSVAAGFFRKKGIPILRFGDQTEIGLKEHNLPINEKNERWYRETLRQELGMAAMAIKIEPRVKEAEKTHDVIVLDGLYSWEEYVYLKEKLPGLRLLCIFASPQTRYKRLEKRAVRPLTAQEAQSRDAAEIENLHKGGPIAMADYVCINESTEEELIDALEGVYRTLL